MATKTDNAIPCEATQSLEQLAAQANEAHDNCEAAIRSALQFARTAGDKLIAAKKLVVHGDWEFWARKNCKFSVRTARAYMRIAANWEKILNRQHVADLTLDSLSLREALRILASPKDSETSRLELIDKECPSCGNQLAKTSAKWATCVNCWDCRLHGLDRLNIGEVDSPLDKAIKAVKVWRVQSEARIHAPDVTLEELIRIRDEADEVQRTWAEFTIRCQRELGKLLAEAEVTDGTQN